MINAQHKSADSLFSSPKHRKPLDGVVGGASASSGGGGVATGNGGGVGDPFAPTGVSGAAVIAGDGSGGGALPSTNPGFSSSSSSAAASASAAASSSSAAADLNGVGQDAGGGGGAGGDGAGSYQSSTARFGASTASGTTLVFRDQVNALGKSMEGRRGLVRTGKREEETGWEEGKEC